MWMFRRAVWSINQSSSVPSLLEITAGRPSWNPTCTSQSRGLLYCSIPHLPPHTTEVGTEIKPALLAMYCMNTPHSSLHNSINTCASAQTSTGYSIAWDQSPSHTEKADDVKIPFSSFAYALCWSSTQTPLLNSTLACIHPRVLPSQSLGFPCFATSPSPSPEGSSRGEKQYAQVQESAENKKRLKKTLPKNAKKIIKSMRKLRLACTSFNGSQILEAKISHQHSAFRVCSCETLVISHYDYSYKNKLRKAWNTKPPDWEHNPWTLWPQKKPD